ncbi:hypothetical protein DJ030_01615 [bacterium endosymbiont of Escarpia laminata]|nr:MAG: hypothetical protein DJ030_01615 [bacterium endosymbiont of Escarpia laminata]
MPNRNRGSGCSMRCVRPIAGLLFCSLVLAGCANQVPRRDLASPATAGSPPLEKTERESAPELPEQARLQLSQALTAMRDGRDEEAEPLLRALADEFPGFVSPRLNLGILLLRGNQAEAAETALRQVLQIDAENSVAQHQLAILLRRQGRFQEALTVYRKLLNGKPDHALAHRNLGILYDLYLDEPRQALAHYQQFAELSADGKQETKMWIMELKRRIGTGEKLAAGAK